LRHDTCISGCNVAYAGARKEAPSKRALRATHLIWNAELAADMVQQPVLSSKLSIQGLSLTKDVPWWNKEFRCHKASMRWLFNQAKTGDWESHKIDKEIKKKNQMVLFGGLFSGD